MQLTPFKKTSELCCTNKLLHEQKGIAAEMNIYDLSLMTLCTRGAGPAQILQLLLNRNTQHGSQHSG